MNNNSSTSSKQLANLLTRLKINDFDIIRKKDIPYSHANNVIINLDDFSKGTHWVALNRKNKLYFDSYGKFPPEEVPKDYSHKTKIIEGIDDQDCGQLCCLWIRYVNDGKENEFYSLFKSLY